MSRLAATALVLAGCVAAAGCFGGSGDDPDAAGAISVFGPYRGPEADHFAASVAAFTEQTGVPIRYTGSADFVSDLERRTVELGDPPDVAMVPQPGVVRALAEDSYIVELPPGAQEEVAANYSATGAELGRIDGTAYGVPFRANVKSLVWYRPDVFADQGWSPPSSLDGLESLASRIEANGVMAPWCLALQAGTATGWPATDWTEDLVLRTAGAEVYDGWATGAVAFADDEIADAFDRFGTLVVAPGRLAGGTRRAIETPTREIFGPLFGDEPGCAMAKQADFAIEWMPPDVSIGPGGDVDFFVLPDVTESTEIPPLVVGADLAVQFRRDPDVDAFMAFLADDDSGEPWAREGGYLSPKTTFDPTVYPDAAGRRLAELVATAPVLAFDASDQMPPSIGSGLLWRGITAWVAGARSYDDLAEELDAAFETVDRSAG